MPFPKESFLYFIWQHQYLLKNKLHAISGEPVEIIRPGYRNTGSGPDFLEAAVRIGDQIWHGHVELHVKASDWYAHHHEKDPAYNAVILHAVYEYDMPVFNANGTEIPSLELKNHIPPGIWENYREMENTPGMLKCRRHTVEPIVWKAWLERLFIERMEHKARQFETLLQQYTYDWESVLYHFLLRYFGMKANTDAFEAIARQVPYKIFRKYLSQPDYLEALLLGTAGLWNPADQPDDDYIRRLKDIYAFLKAKHQLQPATVKVKFGGIRPGNFPTVRLAQFARLYHRHPHLFDELIEAPSTRHMRRILRTGTSPYWETHYIPGKESARRKKTTGTDFLNALLLNVVIPVRYAYFMYKGREQDAIQSIQLAQELPPEQNRITRLYRETGVTAENAADSQALIQLNRFYCNQNNCLNCAVGKYILAHENYR